MRMYLYRNLNAAKQGLPSWQFGPKPKQPLKDADGEPIRHAFVIAADVTFKESPASWARCHRDVRDPSTKAGWDVHAYAVGEVIEGKAAVDRCQGPYVFITYDKEGCGRFIRKDTGRAITFCETVAFCADGHCRAFGRITEE